jgi:hypothetical protein
MFRRLFLAHRPLHQAWMQPPHAPNKYRKKFHAVTGPEIAAHLAGRITIAVPLIGRDHTAAAAALDIDAGGEPAIRTALTAAQQRGYSAFGIVCAGGTSGHNGGHIWLRFDQPTAPDRLRQVAAELAAAAGIAAETYPTCQALRLPLGVHRWTGHRGHLVLPAGRTIDLDAGPPALDAALQALAALPCNPVARLPATTDRHTIEASLGQRLPHAPSGSPPSPITRYNQGTDLLALLEGYGGHLAEQFVGGGAVLHCPCGQHQHGDRRPSLELRPATNPAYGRYIAIGHAPACLFHTAPGQVINAFDVYCCMEHLTPAQAIRQLSRRSGGVHSSQAGLGSPMLALDPAPRREEGGMR